MKKISIYFCSILLVLLASCSKPNPKEEISDRYKDSPRSEVPDALAPGVWVWGSFSPLSHYDNNNHELGRDWEAARQYDVKKDGFVEFGQYLGTRTGRCATEIYTRLKGTIKFEGNRLTFYPVEGSFKTLKRGCTSGNSTTERKAVEDDLKPSTYLWNTAEIDGTTYLRVYEITDVNMQSAVFSYTVAK